MYVFSVSCNIKLIRK